KWTIHQGTPTIVEAGGRSSVLELTHSQPGDELGQFDSPVGSSLYLTDPATSAFADGMIEFDIYFETSGWAGVSAMLTFRMQSSGSYYALRLTSTRDWYSSFVIYSEMSGSKDIGWSESSGFPTGAWSHVVVTVGDSRMSCYRDGVLICDAEDDMWSQGSWGGIGLQNNYYGGIFYVDNFKIPGRISWITYRGGARIDENFGKVGSSLLFDHPSASGDEASFGFTGSCSALISDPSLRNFERGIIEFDIHFDNEGGQKMFTAFRMANEHSYYAARLTSTPGWQSHFVKRNDANSWDIIGEKSYEGAFWPQVWYHVKIIVDRNHFELWKDNELLFSADDAAMSHGSWGGIGFYSAYYNGAFHIDNLKISVRA
ncbi:MAG: LamG-like jellyroll fold domain-containing protein, partial [archaeon]